MDKLLAIRAKVLSRLEVMQPAVIQKANDPTRSRAVAGFVETVIEFQLLNLYNVYGNYIVPHNFLYFLLRYRPAFRSKNKLNYETSGSMVLCLPLQAWAVKIGRAHV